MLITQGVTRKNMLCKNHDKDVFGRTGEKVLVLCNFLLRFADDVRKSV